MSKYRVEEISVDLVVTSKSQSRQRKVMEEIDELAENIRAGVRDHLVSKEMLDVLAVSLHNKLS